MTKQTLNYLRNKYLEESCGAIDLDNYFDSEFADSEWEWATQMAVEEFEENFEDYNDWIGDDDYDNDNDYQEARKTFIKKAIEEFR